MPSAIDSSFIGAGPVSKTSFKTALDTAANEITALQNGVVSVYENRIVNSAMQISQQHAGAAVDVTTGFVYTLDQWVAGLTTTPGGTLRIQQVTSATPAGSPFRLRATAQVADGSLGTGDAYVITQPIEGQMIADARFGSASARTLRLRMGVRSSIAGTFGVHIRNGAFNRAWIGTITIAAGEINTDVLRTLTIVGDATGVWPTNNTAAMWLGVTLGAGTSLQGVAGWQGGAPVTTSAQTNFMATLGATFELFDVGLYVDTAALALTPPFQVPRFDAEMLKCRRYYELLGVGQQFTSAFTGDAQGMFISHVLKRTNTPGYSAVSVLSNINTSSITFSPIGEYGVYHVVIAASNGTSAYQAVIAANARM